MTSPRTVLTNATQARAFLHARSDAAAQTMSDGELPWYLFNRYNVVVDASARLADAPAPAPVAKADATPVAVQVERTDAAPAMPAPAKHDPWAVYRKAHADSWKGEPAPHVDATPRPAPSAPAKHDPFAAYRRAYDEARKP